MGKTISVEEKVAMVMAESRRWEELNPEILASILVRIPADEMGRIVPFVCKPWMEAVAGPYCWRDIDVAEWFRRRKSRNNSGVVDLAVRKLVRRIRSNVSPPIAWETLASSSLLIDVTVFFCSTRCLTMLQMPMSQITDNVVLNHVKSLSNLRVLDISDCSNITVKGLEAFGNQCTSLVCLKRNMSPQRTWANIALAISHRVNDSEVKMIANTMSNLQHLELCYGSFGNAGLYEILAKCKLLTHLDIQGSRNVKLDGDLEQSLQRINYFRSPYVDYIHEFSDSEGSYSCSSDSDDSL